MDRTIPSLRNVEQSLRNRPLNTHTARPLRVATRTLLCAAVLFAGALLSASTASAAPVTTHPRLWITQADLPKLRQWAVPSNPIYQQGLLQHLGVALQRYTNQYFPGGQPNPNYPDVGDRDGYVGLLSEEDALVLAFHSLIDPNVANRRAYAKFARNLLMYVMNEAIKGHQPGQPFRDPIFALYNRQHNTGQNWGLIVDWIYDATDSNGDSILTAADKAVIRDVFMMWGDDCVNAYTTGGDHPAPIGVTNSPMLLPNGGAYRMAANNYYIGHARLMTLAALSLDAADDPPLDPSKSVSQLGNSLRSYITNANGAWLYQLYAMFGDPEDVKNAYGLASSKGLGVASGGLPPEGMLYGHSIGYMLGELLALETAGYHDAALAGPQIALIDAPFWDRFLDGMYASLVPAQQVPPSDAYMGLVYQMASYGDILRLWITPDAMQPQALLALLDQKRGDLSRQDKALWWMIHALEGGEPKLLSRVQHPWSQTEPILYFLLMEPGTPPPADPRPALPTTFYDAPAGRILARSDWSQSASMFDFRCSWISINHQDADAGQFEMYRNGEWLTKEASNYSNTNDGQSSVYHNTLTLKNTCANGTPQNMQWYEVPLWNHGSQWMLGRSAGDPVAAGSSGAGYAYGSCIHTELYNWPSFWTPANAALDIQHASRAILWLAPDHVVVYDRATSKSAGLFKRFHLSLVAQPTVSGNVLTETTPKGQKLYVTSLLPAGATISTNPIPDIKLAWLEPSTWHAQIEDTANPKDVRFLHVLQGADGGTPADNAELVESISGDALEGTVVGNTAAMFVRDLAAPFSSATYVVPDTTTQHYIAGLAPNAVYDVAIQSVGSTIEVTITANGTMATSDEAGLLLWPQSAPPPPSGCTGTMVSPSMRMTASPMRFKSKGSAVIPPPWSSVDPLANGIRITVDDTIASGGGLDATLPGGAYDGTKGWKTSAGGTKWTYLDRSGSGQGIAKASVRDRSAKQAGLLSWSVGGRSANAISLPDAATARTTIQLGSEDECADIEWSAPGPGCVSSGAKLTCR